MSMTTAAIVAASDTAILRDKIVTGLHTRGKKFFLYFRTKDGKERRPKLGTYPVMSVAQARDVAKGLLLEVAKGCDPMAVRLAFRAAPTLAEALERFNIEHLSRRKSGAEVLRMLTACLPADLLANKATAITHDDIYRLHQSKKKAPYAANRLVANLSVLFAKCERWGFRPKGSNPCEGVERFAEKKRKRYMSVVEARKVAERLDAYAKSDPASVAFIYLLILTGARRGEIASARPEWLVGATLQLPDSKTGAKPVFLPPAAMEVLASLPSNGIVPRGKYGYLPEAAATLTGLKSPRTLWEVIRVEAGCPDLRLHDLRHSFASAALSAGYTLAQIGQLLGHSSTQTTQRYAHLMDSTAQAVVAHTANVISERMGRDSNA